MILLDQLTKFVAHQQQTVVLNPGISFSLGQDLPGLLKTGGVALVVAVIFTVSPRFANLWRNPVSPGLFLGGAVSNLLDRLFYGGVVDWLPVPFVNLTNNLADWAIGISLVIILLEGWAKRVEGSAR